MPDTRELRVRGVLWVLAMVSAACLTMSGCAKVTTNPVTSCTADADCPAGLTCFDTVYGGLCDRDENQNGIADLLDLGLTPATVCNDNAVCDEAVVLPVDGEPCLDGDRCQSGHCGSDGFCGYRDEGEPCGVDADCLAGLCNTLGTCGVFDDGAPCNADKDCATGYCAVISPDEVNAAVGTCGKLADGDACAVNKNCLSGRCNSDALCGTYPTGHPCQADTDCTEGFCNGAGSCGMADLGGDCSAPSDCTSGYCSGATNLCTEGELGTSCSDATADDTGECASGICHTENVCADGVAGSPCSAASDCLPDLLCNSSQYCGPLTGGEPCVDDAECPTGHCNSLQQCGTNPLGSACMLPTDCESLFCQKKRAEETGTCGDGATGSECIDATDCDELPCNSLHYCGEIEQGAPCTIDDDCTDGFCNSQGTCGTLSNGLACGDATDCINGFCARTSLDTDGICGSGVAGDACVSADDCQPDSVCNSAQYCGPLTGDEPCVLDTDCPTEVCNSFQTCGANASGQPCNTATDCLTGYCQKQDAAAVGACGDGSAGSQCVDDQDCADIPCNSLKFCGQIEQGAPCTTASDCTDGFCNSTGTCGKLSNGLVCGDASDCLNGYCARVSLDEDGLCSSGVAGDACASEADCQLSLICNSAQYCGPLTGDEPCLSDAECPTGVCNSFAECGANALGEPCTVATDCLTSYCQKQTASATGTCGNGSAGSECTDDTDCDTIPCNSLKYCGQIEQGAPCATDTDCTEGFCNSQETCGQLSNGLVCGEAEDCASGYCARVSVDETGLCGTGAAGQACASDADCQPELDCNSASYCGVLTGGEDCSSDTECPGGTCNSFNACGALGPGQACNVPTDCLSGFCQTTQEGVVGSCGSGASGESCYADGQCLSAFCNSLGACAQQDDGAACGEDADCLSALCNSQETCGLLANGLTCAEAADCWGGYCGRITPWGFGVCGEGVTGDACVDETYCQPGLGCNNVGACGLGEGGATCLLDADCATEICQPDPAAVDGPLFPLETFNDDLEGGMAGFSTTGTGAQWTLVNTKADSGESSLYLPNLSQTVNVTLTMTTPFQVPPGGAELRFAHTHHVGAGYDKGWLELSSDGVTWSDAEALIVDGEYNYSLSGVWFWSDQNAAYPDFEQVAVDLSPYTNGSVWVRWRFTSDSSGAKTGWWIDSLAVSSELGLGNCGDGSMGTPCLDSTDCAGGLFCGADDLCGTTPHCGDGLVEGAEACDAGQVLNAGGAYCNASCELHGPVEQIAIGGSHTCALLMNSTVKCWGRNNDGQSGYGDTSQIGDNELPNSIAALPFDDPIAQVVAGASHTCARFDNGSVKCWGNAYQGQLGYGNKTDIGDNETLDTLSPVPLGAPVQELAAGSSHTCALLTSGSVKCWGDGGAGQLGYGNTTDIGDNETPDSVGTLALGANATQITAGGSHTCALLMTGDVQCWGQNNSGQLGYGNKTTIGNDEPPSTAGTVPLGGTVTQISAGSSHTCARLDTGAVKCWGENYDGQLGYGHTNDLGDNETLDTLDPVPLGAPAQHVAAGAEHTCALLMDGGVKCWGDGGSGRLGYGNTDTLGDNETPDTLPNVPIGSPVTALTANSSMTCALLDTGGMMCWGSNSYGNLGYGNTSSVGDDEYPHQAGLVPLIDYPTWLLDASRYLVSTESEDNASQGSADATDPEMLGIAGSLDPPGDQDTFSFVLTQGEGVRLRTTSLFDSQDCPGNTQISLFDATGIALGTPLGTDDNDGLPGGCSLIDPQMDTFAANLPSGDYYARIQTAEDGATVGSYQLLINRCSTTGQCECTAQSGCLAGETCNANGLCESCVPSCNGNTCGDDGCGGTCGTCADGQTCAADGQCAACTPDCSDASCGDDGCGGSCGVCDDQNACTDDWCAVGSCYYIDAPACDDGVACTTDSCDPNTGCVFEETDFTATDCNAYPVCDSTAWLGTLTDDIAYELEYEWLPAQLGGGTCSTVSAWSYCAECLQKARSFTLNKHAKLRIYYTVPGASHVFVRSDCDDPTSDVFCANPNHSNSHWSNSIDIPAGGYTIHIAADDEPSVSSFYGASIKAEYTCSSGGYDLNCDDTCVWATNFGDGVCDADLNCEATNWDHGDCSDTNCQDTDNDAADSGGGGCSDYEANPSWCGNYDDGDFQSTTMCCACGGGA